MLSFEIFEIKIWKKFLKNSFIILENCIQQENACDVVIIIVYVFYALGTLITNEREARSEFLLIYTKKYEYERPTGRRRPAGPPHCGPASQFRANLIARATFINLLAMWLNASEIV